MGPPSCDNGRSYLLALALGGASATANAESARAADAFVDFFGVNTHLGYYDTAYRDYEGIVKPRLLELSVRHIRDGTGEIRWVGPHCYFTDEEFAGPWTRLHPRYGCVAMTARQKESQFDSN